MVSSKWQVNDPSTITAARRGTDVGIASCGSGVGDFACNAEGRRLQAQAEGVGSAWHPQFGKDPFLTQTIPYPLVN